MKKHRAYSRVSTLYKGQIGLDLDAQRSAAAAYIGAGALLAKDTKVESGHPHKNRSQLLAPLQACRKRKRQLSSPSSIVSVAASLNIIEWLVASRANYQAQN